jgi:hypothetical protein
VGEGSREHAINPGKIKFGVYHVAGEFAEELTPGDGEVTRLAGLKDPASFLFW